MNFRTGSNSSAVTTTAIISPYGPELGTRVCTSSAIAATPAKYMATMAAAASVYAMPRLKIRSTSIKR